MLDERRLDEKLAPQGFVDDFVWAARALIAQRSVALVSVGCWIFPLFMRPRSLLLGLAWLAILPMYFGWLGSERLFFLRRLEGNKVSLPELLSSAPSYIGRFLRLGFLVSIVFVPVWTVLSFLLLHFAPAGSPHFVAKGTQLISIPLMVALDVVLTFAPAALVFTTRSARDALSDGWAMVRATWPRSALYVLCPPLALNMVNAMYSTQLPAVQFVTMPALALLALVAKGATVAFYLRERPVTAWMVKSVAAPAGEQKSP
jgi:hypothetical protein